MKKLVLSLLAVLLTTAIPARAANSPELEKVLRQLDASSAGFHTAQAEFKWDTYLKVVDSTDTQTGTVYFKRAGTTQMAAHILQPALKTFVYDGKTLSIYNPGIKQISQFSAGKNKQQTESFLTLGFGGSGKDLEANWEIKLIGTEKLKDGSATVSVAHLSLVSKQQSIREMFSRIEIWVDPARDVSLKQILTEPSGDVHTDIFYSIKTNADIDPKLFTLNAKALGAQVINH